MIDAPSLTPLIVAGPLAIAGAMLACAHVLPRRVPDVAATLTALGVAALALLLADHAHRHGVFAYWFGGWTPRPGLTVGIGFGVDPASAALAAFVGVLFATTFVFAWGYFDEVHAHFHVLMLLFLAAMVGFCLTRDLFNLFVWFEVMSVAAFALTAYALEVPSLVGALNFTVTNSLAAFMMLSGVGLIYARAGALDFAALGRVVAAHPHDPVIIGAFCLLAAALMIKAAIVPFQFWLSDAHAVAPSPVSVIFSGAMVTLGLFALAKLTTQVFWASGDVRHLMHDLFLALGALTAVLGGLMAWAQRHIKRLLAFSTIAHLGVMLVGIACLSPSGLAGFLAYALGHGAVKGALFMLAGVLLATRASVDELDLKGLGKGLWPAGLAMGVAGLLLAGAPWGVLDEGDLLIHAAAPQGLSVAAGLCVTAALVFGSAMTGAAVLRVTGRVFLNLGPDPGEEANSPTQQEQEKANRPLWLMLAPCLLLIVLDLAPTAGAEPLLEQGQALLAPSVSAAAGGGATGAGALHEASPLLGALSLALAVAVALMALFRERLPGPLVRGAGRVTRPLFKGLKSLHSGLIGDYVMLIVGGLAAFSIALALQ